MFRPRTSLFTRIQYRNSRFMATLPSTTLATPPTTPPITPPSPPLSQTQLPSSSLPAAPIEPSTALTNNLTDTILTSTTNGFDPTTIPTSYYPSGIMSFLLQTLSTNMSMPAAIMVLTVGIKIACMPASIRSFKANIITGNMAPQLSKLRAEMTAAKEKGDQMLTLAKFQEQRKLYKDNDISFFTPLQGPLINAAMTIPLFFALNNISKSVPSMNEAGALWFSNLGAPDPYYILPAVACGMMLLNTEINSRDQRGATQTPGQKRVMRGVTLLFGLFGTTFASAVTLMWCTSYIFVALEKRLLKTKFIGRLFKIDWKPNGPPVRLHGQTLSTADAFGALRRLRKQNDAVNSLTTPSRTDSVLKMGIQKKLRSHA